MSTFAQKNRESRAATDGAARQENSVDQSLQRADERPAAVAHQALEQSLNQSDKVQTQLRLQQSLNESPRVVAQMKLAATLSGHQSETQSQQPVQRQDALEDEEMIQRKGVTKEAGEVSVKATARDGKQRDAHNKSGVVQRVVGVQIIPSDMDDKLIGGVKIIGRSPAPPGFGGMGSHISMWAMLTDQVESRLVGKSAAAAIIEIDTLVAETESLPGYGNYVNMTVQQQQQQYEAQNIMYAARDKADKASDQAKYLRLQQYIAAYLDWRNLIPFTTFDFGPASATVGQTTALGKLRGYEFQNVNYQKTALQSAVMATLDFDTIDKAALLTDEQEARPDAPGIDVADSYESRMADMLEQHLKIVEKTYPKAFAAAGMTSGVVEGWLDDKSVMGSDNIAKILSSRHSRA
jgi:hypothetical protein